VATILILDDDAANLQGLGALLRYERYEVLEASTGAQAVELGTTRGPLALLVTDMDLPQSSGTEVALKLVSLYSDLPVLLISGTPMAWWMTHDASNFKLFPPAGIAFLEKPFSVSQLLQNVRSLIGGAHPRGKSGSQAA